MTIQVHGLKELQKQLKKLGNKDGRQALARACRKAFKPVLDTAKALAPRHRGILADSLKISVLQPKGQDAAVVVGIKIGAPKGIGTKELPPARRWHFVELGTVKMSAHPFLRPALDQNADRVVELLKAEIRNSIDRTMKKRGA